MPPKMKLKEKLTSKTIKEGIVLGLKISLLALFISFLSFPTMHFYDRLLGGNEEFIRVAESIKNNETDVLATANNIPDNNYNYLNSWIRNFGAERAWEGGGIHKPKYISYLDR